MRIVKYTFVILMIIILTNTNSSAMKLFYDGEEHDYNAAPIKLVIEGAEINTEVPPVILQDRTLVPARDIFEKMGARVDWNERFKQVYITYEDKIVILTIDKKEAYVNQVTYDLDVPPKLINGKTMIPAAFVAKAIGFNIAWDDKDRIVSIAKKITKEEKKDDMPNKNETDNKTEQEPIITDPNAYDISKKDLVWENKKGLSKNQKSDEVKSKKYSEVNIEDVEIVNVDEELINVLINADGKISNLEHSFYDNKVIIDIENSRMKFDYNKFKLPENDFVKAITSSQYMIEPNISRVVIALNDKYNYDVKLSSSRKSIQVSFLKNEVYKMSLEEDDNENIIKIYSLYTPYSNVFRLTNPERIVIDIPYAKSLLQYRGTNTKSDIIKSVRTSQFEENTVRFVIETIGQSDFDVEYKDNQLKLIVKKPISDNVKYVTNGIPKIKLNKPSNTKVDIDSINIKNNYLNKNMQITFKDDYTKEFGTGDIMINDNRVNNINISKVNKNTVINIYTNTIFECKITEDEKYIYIELLKPIQIYDKIVVVDAGHGGNDPGATVGDIVEKDLNLDITKKLFEMLEDNKNIKVYLTRENDTYPTLADRANLANDIEADLFVSVHNNAAFNGKAKGTEILYFPTDNENSAGLSGKKLAELMNKYVVREIDSIDRGIIPRSDLYVLKNTKMPAVIVEVGYMSNSDELKMLQKSSYQKKAAEGIYNAIKEAFDKYKPKR